MSGSVRGAPGDRRLYSTKATLSQSAGLTLSGLRLMERLMGCRYIHPAPG